MKPNDSASALLARDYKNGNGANRRDGINAVVEKERMMGTLMRDGSMIEKSIAGSITCEEAKRGRNVKCRDGINAVVEKSD